MKISGRLGKRIKLLRFTWYLCRGQLAEPKIVLNKCAFVDVCKCKPIFFCFSLKRGNKQYYALHKSSEWNTPDSALKEKGNTNKSDRADYVFTYSNILAAFCLYVSQFDSNARINRAKKLSLNFWITVLFLKFFLCVWDVIKISYFLGVSIVNTIN